MDVTAERIFMSRHSEDLHGRNYSRLGTWHPIYGFPYVLIDALYVNSSFIVEDVGGCRPILKLSESAQGVGVEGGVRTRRKNG